ncbi:MAG: hypothetical protein JWM48_645 [Mycobacterium sp.]|nr:hypothetical protein [Mycobacterium sp.]MCW2744095.1 hypothetical protein [Mycobacterium sp.]
MTAADGPGDDAPLLPESTRDDTDEGWGEQPRVRRYGGDDELSAHDRELLADRPPHHDRG